MDESMNTNEVLYRLLYHRSFRTKFMKDELQSFNLSRDILLDLATIDKDHLEKTSYQIVIQVIQDEIFKQYY